MNRAQLFTSQRDFSFYKRLRHGVPLRGTPAVHSKHYSICTNARAHTETNPDSPWNTPALEKEASWVQAGASVPSHHPFCLCCLAHAQLGGHVSHPFDIGGHVLNFTESLCTGTYNNVCGSVSGASKGSCQKGGEILQYWAYCPSLPFPPLFLTDPKALLHKRRDGRHTAPL